MSAMTEPEALEWGGSKPDADAWTIYLLLYGYPLIVGWKGWEA